MNEAHALRIAAGLALALGLGHSVLGERYILTRLFRRENLPKLFGGDDFTKRTLRFAWHLTTVAWWGLAALLIAASRAEGLDRRVVALVIAGTCFASALGALVGSRGRHLSWVVFLAMGILAAWGAR